MKVKLDNGGEWLRVRSCDLYHGHRKSLIVRTEDFRTVDIQLTEGEYRALGQVFNGWATVEVESDDES